MSCSSDFNNSLNIEGSSKKRKRSSFLSHRSSLRIKKMFLKELDSDIPNNHEKKKKKMESSVGWLNKIFYKTSSIGVDIKVNKEPENIPRMLGSCRNKNGHLNFGDRKNNALFSSERFKNKFAQTINDRRKGSSSSIYSSIRGGKSDLISPNSCRKFQKFNKPASVMENHRNNRSPSDVPLESRYRRGLLKILSTCSDHPNSWQYLEASKKLFASNLRIRDTYYNQTGYNLRSSDDSEKIHDSNFPDDDKTVFLRIPTPPGENDSDSGVNSYCGGGGRDTSSSAKSSNSNTIDSCSLESIENACNSRLKEEVLPLKKGVSSKSKHQTDARDITPTELRPSPRFCNGTVKLSDIRIPLLWKEKDHFKTVSRAIDNSPVSDITNKYAWSVFVLALSGNQIIESTLLSGIDPSLTDITLEDTFTFKDLTPGFDIRLELYGHDPRNSHGSSASKKISSLASPKKVPAITTPLGHRYSSDLVCGRTGGIMSTSLFCTPTKSLTNSKYLRSWNDRGPNKVTQHPALTEEAYWDRFNEKSGPESRILAELPRSDSVATTFLRGFLKERRRSRKSLGNQRCPLPDLANGGASNFGLGGAIAGAIKNSISMVDMTQSIQLPTTRELKPPEFTLLALCHLRLTNIHESVQVHDLTVTYPTSPMRKTTSNKTPHLPILGHFSCKMTAEPICYTTVQASGYVYVMVTPPPHQNDSRRCSLRSRSLDGKKLGEEPKPETCGWLMLLAQLIGEQLIGWSEAEWSKIRNHQPGRADDCELIPKRRARKLRPQFGLEPQFKFPIATDTSYSFSLEPLGPIILTIQTLSADIACTIKLVSDSDRTYWDRALRCHIKNLGAWKTPEELDPID